MGNNNYFENVCDNKETLSAFIKKQQTAPTITVFGPTSSGKSTFITEVLDKKSSKLLARNIGNTAQTTLIKTNIMLNAQFDKEQVILQGVKHSNTLTAFLKFEEHLMEVLVDELYKERDDLEEFEVTEKMIKKILDPEDRSYHIYSFADSMGYNKTLQAIISGMIKDIIEIPEMLNDYVDKEFKIQRKVMDKLKKKDVYEEIINKRYSNHEGVKCVKDCFDDLLSKIEKDWNSWTHVDQDKNNYFYLVKSIDNSDLAELVNKLYDENSPYSLLFEEIRYITAPSDRLRDYVEKNCTLYSNRKLKFNIVDTKGITQSSEDEKDISDSITEILSFKTDALLLLCAADEKPMVFDYCMNALAKEYRKWEYKPLTVCRTKADIVLRNSVVNQWRLDTGENALPSPEHIKEYVKNAVDEFEKEFLEYDINLLNNKIDFKYLSLAPDFSEKINDAMDKKFTLERLFEVLVGIFESVDKVYNSSRLYLYSNSIIHTPLELELNADILLRTISEALISYNARNNNQYTKYINSNEYFHGRSVNCFRNKLSYGQGHETSATIYANFKLYITSMVARWLRDLMPTEELIKDINISDRYLDVENSPVIDLDKFTNQLRDIVRGRRDILISNMAKKLSYDCFEYEFHAAYLYKTWDRGFRDSLSLINNKFSTREYWENNLKRVLYEEVNSILQSMYIYD